MVDLKIKICKDRLEKILAMQVKTLDLSSYEIDRVESDQQVVKQMDDRWQRY